MSSSTSPSSSSSTSSTSTSVVSAQRLASAPRRSTQTIVLQTTHGDLSLKLWPDVAPKTTRHILRLFELGLYQTNHFFRVDGGFVAQVADVESGRRAPLLLFDSVQKKAASETVPLEVDEAKNGVRHDRAGLLSMARTADPNSGRSSFSVMLGAAPHLDGEYTLFGEVLMDSARQKRAFEDFKRRIEALPTRKEGIFVMPTERVEILSTFVLKDDGGDDDFDFDNDNDNNNNNNGGGGEKLRECLRDLKVMEARWKAERGRSRASSVAASAIP